MSTIEIGGVPVGPDHQPFVIAEMSGNHNGELSRALALIDAKRSRGEELYEMVRRFILGTNEDWVLDSAVDKAGRALLLAINPAEDFED